MLKKKAGDTECEDVEEMRPSLTTEGNGKWHKS